MNLTLEKSKELVRQLKDSLSQINSDKVEVAVCPPFVYLYSIAQELKSTDGFHIYLGAQNLFWEKEGAYTGEISGAMLKDIGCDYVIIGHSERRHYFRETDEEISRKVVVSFEQGLLPIICIGETLEQREAGKTIQVVKEQLLSALSRLNASQVQAITIAYEPVWAIGTGRAATPQMAQEVHQMIRETLAENYGKDISEMIRIQYGGSVKPDNIQSLLKQKDIDGALVGGASLKAESFSRIVKAAIEV